MSRPVRVDLSKVPAWVPDEPILHFLKQFGKVASNIRPLPINSNKTEKFVNIISNFREIFINLDKNKKLPGNIQIVNGDDTFSIDVITDQQCYVCREIGHLARICQKKRLDQPINTQLPRVDSYSRVAAKTTSTTNATKAAAVVLTARNV